MMNRPADVQVLRASATMKGPQTLSSKEPCFASQWIFAGGVSLTFQHICSAAPCNWHSVSARNGTRGEKNDSGGR